MKKILFIVSMFLFLVSCAFAQFQVAPSVAWGVSAAVGSSDDYPVALEPTKKYVPVGIDSEIIEVPSEVKNPILWIILTIAGLMFRAGWFNKKGVDASPPRE